MNRHTFDTLSLRLALGIVLVGAHAASGQVKVSNVEGGTASFRYPLVLVEGTFDGDRLVIETRPRGLEVSPTTLGDRFRFLVDLRPGTNAIRVSDGVGTQDLALTYEPPTSERYRLKAWYVVCQGEDPLDPAFNVHLTPLYREKISTQVKLMQAWSAEDMKAGGVWPQDLLPALRRGGATVDVGLIELPMTRQEVIDSPRGIYGIIFDELPAESNRPWIKNLAFTSVKAAAQSDGNFCLVGSKTLMKIGPWRVGDIMEMLHYPVAVDHLTWRAYTGVTLHEAGHMMHKAWHPGGRNNIVQSAYANISRYFTLADDPLEPVAHRDRDLSSWGVHQPLDELEPVLHEPRSRGVPGRRHRDRVHRQGNPGHVTSRTGRPVLLHPGRPTHAVPHPRRPSTSRPAACRSKRRSANSTSSGTGSTSWPWTSRATCTSTTYRVALANGEIDED